MAFWDKISSRGNVTDRRSMVGMGGMGITGTLLLMGVVYLLGGNPLDVLRDPAVQSQFVQQEDTTQYEGMDSYEVFASQVLGSANDAWTGFFTSTGKQYREPELILFRNYTQSACGGANAVVGPHYCPLDEKIYLDETFFDELTNRLGAEGGDVAEAYVIAHEVGHHVQHQLGILGGGSSDNQESIAVELQADCFAGLWGYSIKDMGVLEENEIREAIDAAAAVGDDSIQKKTQGEVHPETWTHGSSAQRIEAFQKGYDTGAFDECLAYTQ